MNTYWISFRIHDDSTYADRYQSLERALSGMTSGNRWWNETTSFVLFKSDLSIDDVATKVSDAFSPTKDLALIGMIGIKGNRVVGAWSDQDLTEFLPNLSQA